MKGNCQMTSVAHKARTVERPHLNRVGFELAPELNRPKTIGQRMTRRRLDLDMTQEQVADKISFIQNSGKHAGQEKTLSRNAYCMYERDEVEPSFPGIESIARVLKISPAWLAFGIRVAAGKKSKA
jgi:hypothetical protein